MKQYGENSYYTNHEICDQTKRYHWYQSQWKNIAEDFGKEVCRHSIIPTGILMTI